MSVPVTADDQMPEEITLAFIARQLERMLTEQRGMRLDLRSLRDEFALLREQVRIQATTLARLDERATVETSALERPWMLSGVALKRRTWVLSGG
jgi:hypothetical protein